jgi:3-hydroxyacyl-CoA dehydrogenase
MAHVIKTMQDTLPADVDPFAAHFATPPVLKALVDKGALGQKSGAGFYRKEGKAIKVLEPGQGRVRRISRQGRRLVARILKKKDPAERLKLLRETDHPQAKFLWAIFRDAFHYIAVHTGVDRRHRARCRLRAALGIRLVDRSVRDLAGGRLEAGGRVGARDIDAGEALANVPLPKWVFRRPGRAGRRRPHRGRIMVAVAAAFRRALGIAGLRQATVPRTAGGRNVARADIPAARQSSKTRRCDSGRSRPARCPKC